MDDYERKIVGSDFGGRQWFVGIRKSKFAFQNDRAGGSRKRCGSGVCRKKAGGSSQDYPFSILLLNEQSPPSVLCGRIVMIDC